MTRGISKRQVKDGLSLLHSHRFWQSGFHLPERAADTD